MFVALMLGAVAALLIALVPAFPLPYRGMLGIGAGIVFVYAIRRYWPGVRRR
jgi:membrane protein implicated in regulation of membrane protease activity